MRLPFFRSQPQATTPSRGERTRAAAPADESTLVEAARTRARRRLIGALVLLVVGVVGFPIVFETQPRPLPVDTPILTPSTSAVVRREAAPPAATRPTAQRPAIQPVVEAPAEAVLGEAPASAPSPRPQSAVQPVVVTERTTPPPSVPTTPAPVAVAPAAVTPAAAAASRAVAAAPAASAAASATGSSRFVVQVGAYTDPATLREARAKVEKLGLKTYTQVVASDAGPRTRVRLGPYASRDEADAAAAKLKRAGLPANILTL